MSQETSQTLCHQCGKPVVNPRQGQKYCSDTCRVYAHRKAATQAGKSGFTNPADSPQDSPDNLADSPRRPVLTSTATRQPRPVGPYPALHHSDDEKRRQDRFFWQCAAVVTLLALVCAWLDYRQRRPQRQ